MKVCAIDSTLNEGIKPKEIAKLIEPSLLNVKLHILKNHFWKKGLNRKTLERSHVLFITQPRKRLTKEEYIELVSYVDIGGTLILTYNEYFTNTLGRWFKNMREELGIELKDTVFGLPKISEQTRLIGTKVKLHKGQTIKVNTDPKFLKFQGIRKYIPLIELNQQPIALAAYKRRGSFIIFTTNEIFDYRNKVFMNKLLYIILNRLSFELEEKIARERIGNSDYYYSLHHACFYDYVFSLYHHEFLFNKKLINIRTDDIVDWMQRTISEVKVEGIKPTRDEILEAVSNIKRVGEKLNAN